MRLRGGSTHRRSACSQGRTGSRVCTGTCSSLWCSGTRSSCRSQATGTRWYLWNMQRVTGETSEVFPDYGNLITLCFPFCWETPRELLGQTWCKYWYQILCAAILHRAWREFFFFYCLQTGWDVVRLWESIAPLQSDKQQQSEVIKHGKLIGFQTAWKPREETPPGEHKQRVWPLQSGINSIMHLSKLFGDPDFEI